MGTKHQPYRIIVQAPGSALRLPADALWPAARRSPVLLDRLLRYADAFLIQVSQSAVCN